MNTQEETNFGTDLPEKNDNIEMDINSDADIPGTNHLTDELPSNEDEGISQIDKLISELAEQKDKFLRQAAEFENYKRRTAKERMELFQTAGKDIIVSLLDVLDDTSRAEKQMENSEDINQLKEGNALIFNKLKNILSQKGLKPMDCIGEEFDVEQHEAITEVPVADDQKGKVIDEVQKGYLLNDKIIRFAKVVVGK